MRKAKVMLGQRENSAPYIYIQEDPLKAEAIRVSFDSETEFNKWLEVVQQSRKTDAELIEIQKQKQAEQNEETNSVQIRKNAI